MRQGRARVAHWHAGFNQPGYLPTRAPSIYSSFEAAREGLAYELESHAGDEETWAEEHECGNVPCEEFGEACNVQRASRLRSELADLRASEEPEWSTTAVDLAYWITMCDEVACVEEMIKTLARDLAGRGPSALSSLAQTGAILDGAAEEADEHRQAATAAEQSDIELLCAYIDAIGERGPVPEWTRR